MRNVQCIYKFLQIKSLIYCNINILFDHLGTIGNCYRLDIGISSEMEMRELVKFKNGVHVSKEKRI